MRLVRVFTILMVFSLILGCSENETTVTVEPNPLDGFVLCQDCETRDFRWVPEESCFFYYPYPLIEGSCKADTIIFTPIPVDTVYINMPPYELLKRLQCYEEWFDDYPMHPGRDCKEKPECLR